LRVKMYAHETNLKILELPETFSPITKIISKFNKFACSPLQIQGRTTTQ
jgi:hypothetical protein